MNMEEEMVTRRTALIAGATVALGAGRTLGQGTLKMGDGMNEEVKSPTSDQERLQGVWKVLRAEVGGKPDDGMDLQLTFAKGRVEYQTNRVLHEGTFRLNPQAKPKQLDIQTDAWRWRAIYRFHRGTLVLAGGNPSWDTERPTDFAAAKRDKFLWTMERVLVTRGPTHTDARSTKVAQMKRARLRCGGQLERLVRAMHSYHDTHGHFPPPAMTDRSGKPLLSWRVELLPYLGEKDLYQQFRLDESWDSLHNRKLLAKIPTAYSSVGRPPKVAYGTFNQVFAGKSCLFELGKQIALEDVTDGTVSTIAVIAAAKAVPWTKPTDLVYMANQPLPSFADGMIEDGLISFATADSCPHVIPNAFDEVKEKVFRAAITRNDRELADFARFQQ
jgi:uncharacterized protein (TIGR03067 family)